MPRGDAPTREQRLRQEEHAIEFLLQQKQRLEREKARVEEQLQGCCAFIANHESVRNNIIAEGRGQRRPQTPGPNAYVAVLDNQR